MSSKSQNSFLHYFFQDLYTKLGKNNGVCALKGSFVIDESGSSETLVDELIKLVTRSPLTGFLKTHTLFSGCQPLKMYEIKFKEPLLFKCRVNENCFKLECNICKYYHFTSNTSESKKYLFLKFERYETLTIRHAWAAFNTYQLGRDEKKTLTKCTLTTMELPDKNFFYHAENRLFEPEKHKMLSKVYVNTPFDFEKYKKEKQNYNKCADFTKLKSIDASQCRKEKEEKETKEECLSNDIYVPYTHVLAMKDQFEQKDIESFDIEPFDIESIKIESNKPDDSRYEQNVGFGGRKQTSSRKRKQTSSRKRKRTLSRKQKGTYHRRKNVCKRKFC
jgi:hypothetical protein